MSQILSQKQVCELTNLSRTTIWKLMRENQFPQKISLTNGPRGRVGWRADEVQAWIDSRARGYIGHAG